MPMHISRLKDLQLLTAFVVGKCSGSGINELKELHRLHGTLSISGLQNVTTKNDAFEAKMREKKHIEKLALEWGSTTENSENERDVLEKLEPHTNLKHLEIKNYGGTRFPAWLGNQSFCNMASLRLEKCEFCFSLPPLGQLRSLKELTISKMSGIANVDHEFYGESGSLIKPFESLETLRFEQMPEWVQWLQLDAGEFSRLQKLEVIKCPKLIGDLPKNFPSLVRLEIKECPKLVVSLPRTTSVRELELEKCKGIQVEWQGLSSVEKLEISSSANFKEFENGLLTRTNLKELMVKDYPRLLLFTEGMMMCLSNLEDLRVSWCKEMSHCYTSLVSLTLSNCHGFKSLPLGLFPKLQDLTIIGCINFETLLIPDGNELQNLTLLQYLYIDGPNEMVSFPCGGLPAPNLYFLFVSDCEKLKALPQQMHTLLPSLLSLELSNCPEIESFPEGGLPSKLSTLVISSCKKLVGARRDWGLQTLPSVTHLMLGGEYEDVVDLFPEEGLLPSTLTSLHIGRLPNLKTLNNKGLQLLGNLKHMLISHCPQLVSLPEEGLPTSLFALEIVECPLVKARCRKEEGEDWPKVAHVPAINMDGEAIFEQVYLGPVDPYECFYFYN
ncbi:hypothetical protein Vadar_022350 [Vaccinium darrowii]|uniref:Uncharacterized protein n=1 Tax=Vaccinium darrowii TaxID=229202 RepID=A0ACB7XJE9_9ERIC|nr:hypothetical protein Vadar_022350 [Vaccinium darrowii]